MTLRSHLLGACALLAALALGCLGLSACTTANARSEGIVDLGFYVELGDGHEEQIDVWGDGETYYVFLPAGAGTDRLTVETANGITLRKTTEGEGERREIRDGETLDGIDCDEPYLLGTRNENGYLYELPTIFMEGANVNSVFIDTESESMQALEADKDYEESGSMVMADGSANVVYDGELSSIKGRGNGSWYSHKKPFNLKLAEPADLLGTGKGERWCLLSQETDETLMHNKVAFDLAKEIGLDYSPDAEYVDVWFNGAYNGLYLLTDYVTISEASVDITNLEDATADVNFEDPSDYPNHSDFPNGLNIGENYQELMQYNEIPNNPDDITGGYLLEVDRFYPFEKTARFNTADVLSVTLKSPKYASKEEIEYIRDYVTRMEAAIKSDDDEAYKQYIDTDSWAKFVVLEELLGNPDFMGNSTYFYKDVDTPEGESLIYAGPIWDMEIAGVGDDVHVDPNMLLTFDDGWFRDLYEKPSFMEEVRKVFIESIRPAMDKLLDGGLDAIASEIEPSAEMNFVRWKAVFPNGPEQTMDMAISDLKAYLTERLDFFQSYLLSEDTYHKLEYTWQEEILEYEDYYNWNVYMIKDGEPGGDLGEPPEHEGYVFKGFYYGSPINVGEPYDPNAPITEDTRVSAIYEKVSDE